MYNAAARSRKDEGFRDPHRAKPVQRVSCRTNQSRNESARAGPRSVAQQHEEHADRGGEIEPDYPAQPIEIALYLGKAWLKLPSILAKR